MDLLEYQAKNLFREMGIPILPSQTIGTPKDLKGLRIPYPVVLKSQVRAGGRGRAGGIKFAGNTIDAVAAAQTIFALPIMNEYPEVILAEAKYDANQELYLAVFLDPVARRPVLLGSKQGGIDVEATMEQMQQVIVSQEFSPFYARRLMIQMGLEGNLIHAVSNIVERMYQLFVEKDLDLIEINPLGISLGGEVMALDGKISVNDQALQRHPELLAVVNYHPHAENQTKTKTVSSAPGELADKPTVSLAYADKINRQPLSVVDIGTGNIGILGNGEGLTMATVDLVVQEKGKPANCLNLRLADCIDRVNTAEGGDILPERIDQALDLLIENQQLKVILVNILGYFPEPVVLINLLIDYLKKNQRSPRPIKFVVRLVDGNMAEMKEVVGDLPIDVALSLDEAVHKAVSLAKSRD
jgi:succinyl-CoA synthetase beta subunit